MSTTHESTRDRLLSATLALLQDGSGSAVRMSDIARKAGISRQALYAHFPSRADLLAAATHRLDDQLNSDSRLAASRAAPTGKARLDAFVEAWTGYVPMIYGPARAFLDMERSDAEAYEVWQKRMDDMWEGCEAAIQALARDGDLTSAFPPETATDLLWTLLTVPNWENLTQRRDWSQSDYATQIKTAAHRLFLR